MSQTQPLICLYAENVSDIQKAIDMGKKASYGRVVSRITCQQLSMRERGTLGDKRNVFTRSELLLNAKQWRQNIIMKVGEFNDCDSRDKFVWKQSNQSMKQEVDWARHLDELACVMVTLNSDQSTNLARQLLNCFDTSGCVLAEIPIVDKSFFKQNYTRSREIIELSTASADVWHRWNNFRLTVDFNSHFKVALELTPYLPSEGEINRWCGEPVEMIIIPSTLFKSLNNNNQISLEQPYRDVCLQLLHSTQAHFAVRCTHEDPWMSSYAHCLRNTFYGSASSSKMNHECNNITLPGLILSPKDTINNCYKYQQNMFGIYEQAIRLAIADRLQSEDKVRLMICGRSGWKLLAPVMATIGGSEAVEVFVYEEDPCSQISINDIIDSLYSDKKVAIIGDAEAEMYFNKMDILVSVTLEAIYESQRLQFNFDRVRNYMRSDAILIPQHSSLSIVPVTAARVHSHLQDGQPSFRRNSSGIEHYDTRAQTIYPLYTRNLYECAAIQELFSFRYPTSRCVHISSETRLKKLAFQMERDCTVTGFCGFYQATMYKNIKLDNRTWFKHHNKNCIPMVYFPLRTSQTLKAETNLETIFWFIGDIDQKKYWYEWQTTAPNTSATQNLCGSSCFIQQSMVNTQ